VDATSRKCREASLLERMGAERKRDSAQPEEKVNGNCLCE